MAIVLASVVLPTSFGFIWIKRSALLSLRHRSEASVARRWYLDRRQQAANPLEERCSKRTLI